MNKSLVGKKDICAYAQRSWITVKRWIQKKGFPARKIDGRWESDTELIDEWKRAQIKTCQ